ncbi:hypothetical protein [Acetoanaerobium noterae]|nr:hypothetical protein [Acetoanaerobium noterae]
MKNKRLKKKNKINEQILAISTHLIAIDVIFSHIDAIADFVQKVLLA